MPFDPNLPADHSEIVAAELRNQFNALKALIDAQAAQITELQTQLAPLIPMINRDAGGSWTLTYSGPSQSTWQIQTRYEGSPDWSEYGEIQTNQFPASDDVMAPGGSWWQVKICGEGANGNPSTPFSNVISFGTAPS